MNNHIVFCQEHYNPLGIVRSLGEKGIKPIVIVIKDKIKLVSKSKYIEKIHFVKTIEEGYELLINIYSNNSYKSFLYTSDDQITNYIDSHYDELKDYFYFFNAGAKNRISYYMNKDNINQLAIKCGLNVAKTWVVKPGDIPKDIEYPIITKAIISTINNWKDDVFICNNNKELKEAFKKIRSEKILIQKYIEKKNELCIDGFSVNKGKNVFYGIASNYTYTLKDAYSFSMILKNVQDEKLKKKISSMFEKIGFEGIFSIEFLIDQDDNLYFLEINFRNSTWSYASTKAGMNLPVLWSKSMLDPNIVEKSYVDIPDNFIAINEFADYNSRVKTHMISKKEYLKEIKNASCLYYYNKKDKRPFYSYIICKVKEKIKI